MTNLTKTRLEAIIDAIGQALAGASETDIDRTEYEAAREWASEELRKRVNGFRYREGRYRRAPVSLYPGARERMNPGPNGTILFDTSMDLTSWKPSPTAGAFRFADSEDGT